MKNILLFATFVLSNIAFGQNWPTSGFLQDSTSHALPVKIGQYELEHNAPIFFSGTNLERYIPQDEREIFDLIQQYDSIYQWKWDTLIEGWQVNSKYVDMVYDADHLLISETRLGWNGTEWLNDRQYTYTYDEDNNRISSITKSWTGTAWENSLQNLSTYYSTDSTTLVAQQWNGIEWINSYRTFIAYDGYHNLTNVTIHDWGLGWLPRERYTYTYDTLNNLTSQLYERGLGMDWENYNQSFHTYDGNKNRILSTSQNWNGSSWDNYELNTYTYDSSNNRTETLTQTWIGFFWENFGKLTITYNANNNFTSVLGQIWYNGDWENSNRYTYTYDGNLRTSLLSETWNGFSWLPSRIQFFTYDENNFHLGTSSRDYNDTGDLVIRGDSTHYYFQTFTDTEDLTTDDSDIIIYPNPSKGTFTIGNIGSLGTIGIYDLNGKKVFASGPASDQTSMDIDLTRYGTGVYLININDGIKVISRKVVVQ